MPRVVRPASPTPMIVLDAIAAFSSPLRLELIRHYRRTPSTQSDAARALGVQQRVASSNTAQLVRVGVLVEKEPDGDRRRTTYAVDEQRVGQLSTALRRYAAGETAE